MMGSLEASPLFDWLWSSSNLGKHKFFFWLLLRDQLNTRNILRRKNTDLDDYNCVLLQQWLWRNPPPSFLLMSLQPGLLEYPTHPLELEFGSSWHGNWSSDYLWSLHFQRDHDYSLLDHLETRNDIIFDNGVCNLSVWKRHFKEELGLVCTKAKPATKGPLSVWWDNYS